MSQKIGVVAVVKEASADRSEQVQRNGVHRLSEKRGVYEAVGAGSHPGKPILSAEASQPTPFMSLSWPQWMETRELVMRCLDQFALAAEEHRADKVLRTGMDLQDALNRILLEAYVMSANFALKSLTHE